MAKPEFIVTPGYGDRQLRLYHYSQAVRVGDRVETSGQGGWNDEWKFPEAITDEIAQAQAPGHAAIAPRSQNRDLGHPPHQRPTISTIELSEAVQADAPS